MHRRLRWTTKRLSECFCECAFLVLYCLSFCRESFTVFRLYVCSPLKITLEDVFDGLSVERVQQELQRLRHNEELAFSTTVWSLSTAIDKHLLHLLMSRFHLHTHLSALKKFMLLGQGDFVTVLMDGVGPELKKRANQLFRHDLTAVLEGMIHTVVWGYFV
jgi:hypothetical protein